MADPYSPYQNQPTQPGGYYPQPGQGGQPGYPPGPYGPAPGAPGYGPGGPDYLGAPGGPYGPGAPPPRKNGSTGVIIGLIAGVLALIVGVAVAIYLVFPDEPTVTTTGPSSGGGVPQGSAPQAGGEPKPTEFYESGPNSHYAKLASRSADANPATLDEVFGEAKRLPSYGPFRGIQVTLKDSRLDTDCTAAAWGSGLQQTLRTADCNQMIRGVYVDDANKYLGQIFILNLRDEAGALSVVRAIDPDVGNAGFFKPLTSPPAASFGQGNSEARAEISGHWVVLSWVQYTDGSRETSFGDFIPMGVIIRNASDFIVRRNIDVGG